MRFRLLQAREPDEVTAHEERCAFASRLNIPVSELSPYDLLAGTATADAVTAGVDAVLVGGSGRFGINDDAPWITPFLDTLGELVNLGFPTFASCFGFQGLCVAMGTPVVADQRQAEVGTFEMACTTAAADDPLFGDLPARFNAQAGHKDSASGLPATGTLLARSKRCAVQAVRLGDGLVYATQFHPELSAEDNRLRFRRYLDLYQGVFGRERAHQILDEMSPSPEANDLLPRFAQLVRVR